MVSGFIWRVSDYYEEMPEYAAMQTLVATGIKQIKTTEVGIKGYILKENETQIKKLTQHGRSLPTILWRTTKVEGTPYDEEVSDIH